jgi:DNA-binding GntR family transcriptional regulator
LDADMKTKLAVRPVSKSSVTDQVYRQVRDLILDGEIEPGQTVTIQSLADAFGVSAMPVREALHRLVAAKALTVVSGRSVGVAPLTANRLVDLTRVRKVVEGLAAEWAAAHVTAADLDRLQQLIERMESAAIRKDRRQFVPANRAFHFLVYERAHSDSLLAVIESLWLQISPYFDLLHAVGNWHTANLFHRALLDALSARNGGAARQALMDDIDAAARALSALLTADRQSTVAGAIGS